MPIPFKDPHTCQFWYTHCQRCTDETPQLELAALEGQLTAASEGGATSDLVVPRGSPAGAALAYIRAYREVRYRESIVELLERQYEAARIDEARQGTAVQVVDAPAAPDAPSSPAGWLILLAGLAAAPFAGLMAAWATEWVSLRLSGTPVERTEAALV